MAGFTDEERERIREQLIEIGHELLLQYGPKKTTVADITEPTRIAKPTFYQFFDSKSDLYLVILQRELEEYMTNVRSELLEVDNPQEGLERFFRCYAEFGEENPFIQQTIIKGNYQDILRNVSQDQLAELQRQELAEFVPIIEDLQKQSEGPISEMEPLTVLGIMGGSVGLLILHKDEYERYERELDGIKHGYYEHVRNALIETLAKGLTAD
ncbi:TetR/AcrR family transcriptional regulator [Halocatena pleomorpha]|uniref:TetR/AcrR family transcriptional regulator n=1 Tax=Halocatena pleomorpha TaxID=1785090 RepID=A0A3P3RAU2_9EURY|nr:TetR/AcrR family transcriptional regulator [Halocatena pleomorpha]RRJ30079.1 TetR/AcrR family transcriptional regulator [Halocatena pleomorpha]